MFGSFCLINISKCTETFQVLIKTETRQCASLASPGCFCIDEKIEYGV